MRKIRKMLLVIAVVFTSMVCSLEVYAAEASNVPELSQNVMSSVNQIRKANGLAELTYNTDIQAAADTRAKESSICWSHTRPDGTDFWSIDSRLYGENLGMSEGEDPANIVNHWMDSQTHRSLLLAGDFKSASVGVYTTGNTTYITMEFGY